MRRLCAALLALCLLALAGGGPVGAQELSALARLDPARSRIAGAAGGEIAITLALSQPVPWRVRVLDGPPRLVLDMREVDWRGSDKIAVSAGAVRALRAGVFRAGWSRLVLELDGPYAVAAAEMRTTGGTAVELRLSPATPEAFRQAAHMPEPPEWALPEPSLPPALPQRTGGPLRVVLDPGHGGLDPGAERAGLKEADLMLGFARELKERLIREGGFDVTMTREDDVFVPLETRISLARAAGAQVFLSLHADAIAEGEATGATIYRLADEASDEASRTLAERHDRDDLLSGVDLTRQDDLVATILMDMARTDTQPRTDRLANALADAMQGAGVKMHRHPIQAAGFSVLKSPDIPSLLLELGFLSSGSDRERLNDPAWRAAMQGAILQGLRDWQVAEGALQP